MSKILDVRHLRLVSAIAREGSLSKAADTLKLTPSALSHQLRGLEERLGTPLFLRMCRGLAFTPAGRRLLALSDRVLGDLAAVERDLAGPADSDQTVRIACDCYSGYAWAAPLLRGEPVEWAAQATRRCADALLVGEVDLALSPVEVADSRLTSLPLYREEMVALIAADHPLAKKRWLEPADFADQHALAHTCDDLVLKNFLHKAGVEPRRVTTVMVTEAAAELARAGAGVSVMGRWSAEPLASRELVVRPLGKSGRWRLWRAMTLKARADDALVGQIIARLKSRVPDERRAAEPREQVNTDHQSG
jgi:LysR family transcriptional regulator for metE and metH